MVWGTFLSYYPTSKRVKKLQSGIMARDSGTFSRDFGAGLVVSGRILAHVGGTLAPVLGILAQAAGYWHRILACFVGFVPLGCWHSYRLSGMPEQMYRVHIHEQGA